MIAVEAEDGRAGLEIADRVGRAAEASRRTPPWRWSPPRRPTVRRSCGCGRRPRRRRSRSRPSAGRRAWRAAAAKLDELRFQPLALGVESRRACGEPGRRATAPRTGRHSGKRRPPPATTTAEPTSTGPYANPQVQAMQPTLPIHCSRLRRADASRADFDSTSHRRHLLSATACQQHSAT